MEPFLFPDGPKVASFRGMRDYISLGAELSNSPAPFTYLLPSFPLHFNSLSHPPIPPLSPPLPVSLLHFIPRIYLRT